MRYRKRKDFQQKWNTLYYYRYSEGVELENYKNKRPRSFSFVSLLERGSLVKLRRISRRGCFLDDDIDDSSLDVFLREAGNIKILVDQSFPALIETAKCKLFEVTIAS